MRGSYTRTVFLFVGERRSGKAVRMGVRWEDGRLAAKQLFDALLSAGIDPAGHRYDNLFTPEGPLEVCPKALRRVRRALAKGLLVVAMGQRVKRAFLQKGIPHLSIVHPAARGRIRAKAAYAEHVRSALTRGSPG